ncbi:MAG: hypothetical protein HC810_00090 [Acaryochloridaceae cyanobacterium RL_2_7]|nr:hypothetical protein [Acaryochloridaceae cyanobacterium RL_2_7]
MHDICRNEIALLEEGYKKLTLASIYIPRYRAAIKQAITDQRLKLTPQTSHEYEYQQRVTGKREQRHEHWALTYFKYTPEEYEQLDHRQAVVNQKRLQSLKTVELDRYLNAIDQLLHSQDKFAPRHQAIAIAALTGRRMGEVVARGQFQLTDHPYQLHFTGQQKHERNGYDILTLVPSVELLDRIQKFRAQPDIQDLLKLEGAELKQQLNKFDVQINKECNKYLHQTHIVPPLEGKKNVTIHNLRSLWGAIACHFFCPEDQHEYAFLQHYLGHVLKSSATGHYFRYQLIDANGKRITSKGTKLKKLPRTVQEPPAKFHFSPVDIETIEEDLSVSDAELNPMLLELQQSWQQRWETVEQRLQSVEKSLSLIQPSPEALTLAELTQENEALQTENQKLSEQLRQAESKLEQFRQLLFNDPEPEEVPVQAAPVEAIQQPVLPLYPINKTKAKRLGRKPGKAVERAKDIFYQVQSWNQNNPDNTFAINPGFLESVFHINRKAAQQFCKEFKTEIFEHHQDVKIHRASTHNRGKNTQDMIKFVEQSTNNS